MFNPSKSAIYDVREGRCWQRYVKILELDNKKSTLSIMAYDIDNDELEVVDVTRQC